jgi:uncharacterized membrane protein YphA (DoxX/SURF4 family)
MSAVTSPRSTPHLGVFTLRMGLALLFVVAGLAKLSGMTAMVALFNTLGLGQWLRYLVGIIEVVGALLLFTQRLAGVGALILSAVMVGAVITQGFIIKASPLVPLAVFAMLMILVWLSRAQTAQLLARLRVVLRR